MDRDEALQRTQDLSRIGTHVQRVGNPRDRQTHFQRLADHFEALPTPEATLGRVTESGAEMFLLAGERLYTIAVDVPGQGRPVTTRVETRHLDVADTTVGLSSSGPQDTGYGLGYVADWSVTFPDGTVMEFQGRVNGEGADATLDETEVFARKLAGHVGLTFPIPT
jgi:hypothetical protein